MNVMQQLLMMNVETLLKDFAAYRTFHKSDAVINMRIPHEVLDRIKEIAAGQGVPYQSLISSVLFALISSENNDIAVDDKKNKE
jgi:predicted DNA binding CopG/RHH family protein